MPNLTWLRSKFTERTNQDGNFSPCSVADVLGKQKINSENITRILDGLLEGYDNRLRPGSGGKHRPHSIEINNLVWFNTV